MNFRKWLVAGLLPLSATAFADTLVVTFPEVDGPSVNTGFPLPAVAVATQNFTIPAGHVIISATASGFWGSTAATHSTAKVNVNFDGVLVAACADANEDDCYFPAAGEVQRPWSYNYSTADLATLADGAAQMTYVQTSQTQVRLGVSTLTIETAPAAVNNTAVAVPANSLAGLLAIAAALMGVSLFYRRRKNA